MVSYLVVLLKEERTFDPVRKGMQGLDPFRVFDKLSGVLILYWK